jgi:hypothetical protein
MGPGNPTRGRGRRCAPSTYIDHLATGEPGRPPLVTHSWRDHTRLNLLQRYGERTNAIMAGLDPKTQIDISSWNNLGQRAAA